MQTSLTNVRSFGRAAATVRRGTSGFTLVEILIVVVILGILAAIVLPQFSNASKLARENTLKDELRYLRTQITVYKAQHRDQAPGYQNGALAGSGVDVLTIQQLTQYTDEAGNCSPTTSDVYKYGPYLLKMPPNPLTQDSNILVQASAGTLVPDNSTGWAYNPLTGDIIANSTLSDASGVVYSTY